MILSKEIAKALFMPTNSITLQVLGLGFDR